MTRTVTFVVMFLLNLILHIKTMQSKTSRKTKICWIKSANLQNNNLPELWPFWANVQHLMFYLRWSECLQTASSSVSYKGFHMTFTGQGLPVVCTHSATSAPSPRPRSWNPRGTHLRPTCVKQSSKMTAQASAPARAGRSSPKSRPRSAAGKCLSSATGGVVATVYMGLTQRGCTRSQSSNEAVITEKCQVFRPAADSSVRLATVQAQPTQSKVHHNNGGHCGLRLIRGVFQPQPSASEF